MFPSHFLEGEQTRKHCAMFLEGGQNMHCFLAMFPEGTWTNQETLFPSHVSRRWANQIQQQYRVLTVFNLTVKLILAVLYYTFRVIQVFNLKMSFCSMLSVMSCFLLENLHSCTVWRRQDDCRQRQYTLIRFIARISIT